MRPWLFALLLLLAPWANAAEKWVILEACGRQEPDIAQSEFDVPFEPAKSMDHYLIRRSDISALVAPIHKSGLKCSYLILNSGDTLLVIGSPEEVQRKITGEAE